MHRAGNKFPSIDGAMYLPGYVRRNCTVFVNQGENNRAPHIDTTGQYSKKQQEVGKLSHKLVHREFPI